MQKEYDGYIELEWNNGFMLHGDAVRLNYGRNALAYLLEARKSKCIWMPKFMCG